ncbi:hypothetical protein MARHY3504 [Marinobacter nauticus ATCC 49840]|nr:hypothetical protein MARHY3504 [Marinobacter nauticus ATCC 49840]
MFAPYRNPALSRCWDSVWLVWAWRAAASSEQYLLRRQYLVLPAILLPSRDLNPESAHNTGITQSPRIGILWIPSHRPPLALPLRGLLPAKPWGDRPF